MRAVQYNATDGGTTLPTHLSCTPAQYFDANWNLIKVGDRVRVDDDRALRETGIETAFGVIESLPALGHPDYGRPFIAFEDSEGTKHLSVRVSYIHRYGGEA